jgi:hypothetical protein
MELFIGDANSFDPYGGSQQISVDNPDDPFGPPLYEGPAWRAYQHLAPGVYTYDAYDSGDEFVD